MLAYITFLLLFVAAATRAADIFLPDKKKEALDDAASRLAIRLSIWKQHSILAWMPKAEPQPRWETALSLVLGAVGGVFLVATFYKNLASYEAILFRSIIIKYAALHVVQVGLPCLVGVLLANTRRELAIISGVLVAFLVVFGAGQYFVFSHWFSDPLVREWALATAILQNAFLVSIIGYTWISSLFKLSAIYLAQGVLITSEFVVRRICDSSKGAFIGISALVAVVGTALGFLAR